MNNFLHILEQNRKEKVSDNMNKKIISLIIGIMCFLLTYGICIQLKTINKTGTVASTNATENELRDSVLKAREKYNNLYSALEAAEKKLEEERTNSTQNNGELENLENQIKEANKIAGITEVTGNGVTIVLNDNQKISSNSFLGDPNILVVHDKDVMRVINELKNAGAEAISINDQRIVPTTAIECDGNVITVNGVKISTPFTIKAIGSQERLIALNRVGGYLEYMRNDRLLEATIKKTENLTIPKYTGVIKFNYAESE